ncbi:hypothetical protein [Martelella alba]|uniref:Leucine-rich repeat (LRR) protein n=1 Tax=Martelella alba TaxID=2590451 RepID=A0ABY2SIS1_9HYPH|nr:hypothetical protein [Martelella alba]TKI05120.1 hypothetical protein FCN80_15580 [Martelella alba]
MKQVRAELFLRALLLITNANTTLYQARAGNAATGGINAATPVYSGFSPRHGAHGRLAGIAQRRSAHIPDPVSDESAFFFGASVMTKTPLDRNARAARHSDDQPVRGIESAEEKGTAKADGLIDRSIEQEEIAPSDPSSALASLTASIRRYLIKHQLIAPEDQYDRSVVINSAIHFIIHTSGGLEKIARQLLKPSGEYGAHKRESLTRERQFAVIGHWLEALVFEEGLSACVAGIIRRLTGQNRCRPGRPLQLPLSALKTLLTDWLESGPGSLNGTLAPALNLNNLSARYILHEVIFERLPMLALSEQTLSASSISIGTLDGGYLHAAMLFMRLTGVETGDYSTDELIALGGSLEDILREGAADPALLALFNVPAALFYARQRAEQVWDKTDDDAGGDNTEGDKKNALAAFFAAGDARKTAANPYEKLITLLENFRSRLQLAQMIRETGIPAAAQEEEGDADKFCAPRLKDDLFEAGENGIDAIFDRQNKRIAEQYALVDSLLLSQVFTGMSPSEKSFLQKADIYRALAEFSSFHAISHQIAVLAIPHHAYVIPLAPDVELLYAVSDGQKRVYALRLRDDGYWLDRVDFHTERYYALMTDGAACRRDPDYKLKVSAKTQDAYLLKKAGEPALRLTDALARKHQDLFFQRLHQSGYDQTAMEKARDFLLSFIPFYDCVTGVSVGRTAAVFSCAMDLIGLVPLVGQGIALGGKFTQAGAKGSLMAYQSMARSLAVRETLRAALQQGYRQLVRQAALPMAAELNRAALITLGVQALKAFDPGLEYLMLASRGALRQAVQAAEVIKNNVPVWKKILWQYRLASLQPSMTDGHRLIKEGRLAGTDKPVSIVRLSGDTYFRKSIYAQIDPRTGAVFGKKYTLSPQGELKAIPQPLAKRLKNILDYGLSGRGAPRAARRMALQTAERAAVSRVPPDVLLRWLENRRLAVPVSRSQFLQLHNLREEQLARYVTPTGVLTADAEILLATAGFNDWNRLLTLPPEIQLIIIRHLDIRSLNNLMLAFPSLSQSHIRIDNLRHLAEERLNALINRMTEANNAWALEAVATEKRWLVLSVINGYFASEHRNMLLAGMRLRRLPPCLPEDLRVLDVSANLLSRLPDNLPPSLHQLDVRINKLVLLTENLPPTLTWLSAAYNQLTRLPNRLPSMLTYMDVSRNNLNILPEYLPETLSYLDISGNTLTLLPSGLPPALLFFKASNNAINQLPNNLPGRLHRLELQSNLLQALPEPLPHSLQFIDVTNNVLSSLPAIMPRELMRLDVAKNRLEALPSLLPPNLLILNAENNFLTHLPKALPPRLKELNVAYNNLLTLPDSLPPFLAVLDANNNMLAELPSILPLGLSSLSLSHNLLRALPENLPDGLQRLLIAYNQLERLPTSLPATLQWLNIMYTGISGPLNNLPQGIEIIR